MESHVLRPMIIGLPIGGLFEVFQVTRQVPWQVVVTADDAILSHGDNECFLHGNFLFNTKANSTIK